MLFYGESIVNSSVILPEWVSLICGLSRDWENVLQKKHGVSNNTFLEFGWNVFYIVFYAVFFCAFSSKLWSQGFYNH